MLVVLAGVLIFFGKSTKVLKQKVDIRSTGESKERRKQGKTKESCFHKAWIFLSFKIILLKYMLKNYEKKGWGGRGVFLLKC